MPPPRLVELLAAGLAFAVLWAGSTESPAASPGTAQLGPNVKLGDDPPSLPASRRAQAEPHIARSFTDPNLLVAIVQEGRFENGSAVACGYAISTDGGVSWRRELIPQLTTLTGGPFLRASDPVAGVDLQNRIYLLTVGLNGTPGSFVGTLAINRSLDRGRSISAPLPVFGMTDPAYFTDKPWLAVNTFPQTPSAGRLAVTFTFYSLTNRFGYDESVLPIVVTHSDDQGDHWSAPQFISTPYCQGSQPFFLPDGALAVVYWNFAGSGGEQVELVLSEDGGVTWGVPLLVAPVRAYADPVARSAEFLPTAASDRQVGVLYVAYQAWSGPGLDAVPGILFTRSLDRGRTWSAPVPVNDTPGGRAVFNPALAVSPDGQQVQIVFYDKRFDTGSGSVVDLYLAESFDGGATWAANRRLSEASSDLTLAPLTGTGRMLGDYLGVVPALSFDAPAVAVWVDTRGGNPDPWIVRIPRRQGATFEVWRRLRFGASDLAKPGVSGAGADPDGDGLPNLLEFALGREPRRPDTIALGVGWGPGWLGGVLAADVDTLAVAEGVPLAWRTSPDLREWSPIASVERHTLVASDPVFERTRTVFAPFAGPVRFFGLGAVSAGGK